MQKWVRGSDGSRRQITTDTCYILPVSEFQLAVTVNGTRFEMSAQFQPTVLRRMHIIRSGGRQLGLIT